MKKFEVVGFGALNWDDNRRVRKIILAGRETSGYVLRASPGGSAANTIVGLSRLGARAAFVGAVGSDEIGRNVLKNLKQEKVKPLVLVKKGFSGNSLVFSDDNGERTIYVFPGVNDCTRASDIPPNAVQAIEESEYFHSSTFACLNSFDSLKTQLALAKKSNMFSFAPGNLYTNPEGIARKTNNSIIQKLLGMTDILFSNREECRMLTGKDDYVKASKNLIKSYGIGTVALTLGKKGCYIRTKNDAVTVPSFKPRRIADTTGAGDAFAAGFLFGLVNRKNPETSGKIGNYVAAKCIEETGARKGLPFLKEMPNI